ncbi:MAG: ribulose-phosphate 3-epimerase [Bacteroidota bacterium]|nr:ribulose-phosphate 3-epimerase [Bacteroidota bacterium]
MKHMISPSLLASNFMRLQDEVEMINNSEADWFHVDVMDGRFVPNITFGPPVVSSLKKFAQKPLDVHLMIVEPEKYFEDFKNAGADILTIHYEACNHLNRNIQVIHKLGMKAGIALNPHTPVSLLEEMITETDMILIMSVNPGFGGQSFIPGSLSKIERLRNMIEKAGTETLIEVDGGVDITNARALFDAGVNVLVAGSAVFKAPNPTQMISSLRNA